jgi:hypothetical protein
MLNPMNTAVKHKNLTMQTNSTLDIINAVAKKLVIHDMKQDKMKRIVFAELIAKIVAIQHHPVIVMRMN